MKINFSVEKRKTNRSGLAPVIATITKDRHRVRINLGLSVVPDAWSQKEQRVYNRHGQTESESVNKILLHRRSLLTKIVTDAELSGVEIKTEYVRSKLQEILNPIKSKKEIKNLPSFFEMFQYHEEKYKATKSAQYIRLFKQVEGHLKEFNSRLKFSDITHKFYSDYMNYLIDAGLQNNTISNHFRKIKVLMKEAQRLGVDVPNDYIDFKNVYRKPKPVWLWPEDISRMEGVALTSPVQRAVRDSFVLRYNLGIRFSDQSAIKKENISTRDGLTMLSFNAIKTDAFNQIAINKKALEIIERYDYKIPDHPMQVHNRHLKTIGELAEINEDVSKVRFAGSKRIEKILPKWKFISTHTARRSFARAWADKGGDLLKLSRYLGHSSIEITLDYIGYDNIEVNTEYLRLFD